MKLKLLFITVFSAICLNTMAQQEFVFDEVKNDEPKVATKIGVVGGFNLSSFFARQIVLNNAEYFDDNDIISLSDDSTKLKVIHTPGHTLDSVIFYDEKNHLAFVGDTIFKAGYGNTQFPGGNEKVLMNSIKQKIFALPEKTVLYSGHSDETTVEAEKKREWY